MGCVTSNNSIGKTIDRAETSSSDGQSLKMSLKSTKVVKSRFVQVLLRQNKSSLRVIYEVSSSMEFSTVIH